MKVIENIPLYENKELDSRLGTLEQYDLQLEGNKARIHARRAFGPDVLTRLTTIKYIGEHGEQSLYRYKITAKDVDGTKVSRDVFFLLNERV